MDIEDQLEHFKEKYGFDWPNCATPDCENKACVPSDRCHPCSLLYYGVDPRPDIDDEDEEDEDEEEEESETE